MSPDFNVFQIYCKSVTTKARTGVLYLPHGNVCTPAFMPIGTLGTVKSLTMSELLATGAQILLSNTYHLWLKPGLSLLAQFQGLHQFNNWSGPILTDSGGFQIFSLRKNNTTDEQGVTFTVPETGEVRLLTPEISMQIQTIINSDIALVLDSLPSEETNYNLNKEAMERTLRWAKRCKQEWIKLHQGQWIGSTGYLGTRQNLLFGIAQGARFLDLRKQSAEALLELDFPGYSIGGMAMGPEPEESRLAQVDLQTSILEEYKPKHLLGVGTPLDIVKFVAYGIDLFDCVYPTRNARHGTLFFELDDFTYTSERILHKKFLSDSSPINPKSRFLELRTYSKSYLRHLFKTKEVLAYRLATLNNLEFYHNLMSKIRSKIETQEFDKWWRKFTFQKVA